MKARHFSTSLKVFGARKGYLRLKEKIVPRETPSKVASSAAVSFLIRHINAN